MSPFEHIVDAVGLVARRLPRDRRAHVPVQGPQLRTRRHPRRRPDTVALRRARRARGVARHSHDRAGRRHARPSRDDAIGLSDCRRWRRATTGSFSSPNGRPTRPTSRRTSFVRRCASFAVSRSKLGTDHISPRSPVDMLQVGRPICYRPDDPTMPFLRSVLILPIVLTIGVAYRPVGAAAPPLTVVHQAPRKPAPGKPPMLVLLHGFGANSRICCRWPRGSIPVWRWRAFAGRTRFARQLLVGERERRRRTRQCATDGHRVHRSGCGLDRSGSKPCLSGRIQPGRDADAGDCVDGAGEDRRRRGVRAAGWSRQSATIMRRRNGCEVFRSSSLTERTISRFPSARRATFGRRLQPMGIAVDYHQFESGHYISDFNVGVLDQWLRRRLAAK